MNKIDNREDMQNVIKTLDGWYSVRLKTDKFSLSSIAYYVDRQFADIAYVNGNNGADYDDLIYISSGNCTEERLRNIKDEYEEEIFAELDGCKLYKKKAADNVFCGVINNDCIVVILYHGKNLTSVPELLCENFEFALNRDLRTK